MRKKTFFIIITTLFFFFGKNVLAGWNVDELEQFNLPDAPVFYIVENVLYWLIGIIGIVSMISFLIAGIMYLTAAGEEAQITKAKSAMKYSIIGVVVALAGFVILQAAIYMLGGSSIF